MNDAERSAFESRLANEPDLKQEYGFHKEIINSIQTERKMELKSMLNEIPVPSASNTGNAGKIAASVVTAAVIVGAIFYFTKDNEPAISENIIVEDAASDTADNSIFENDTQAVEATDEPAPVEIKKQPEISGAAKDPVVKPSKPTITSPNLVDDFETEGTGTDVKAPEIYTETADISTEELFDSNIEVITDKTKKKYQFHYQFKGEKLYLYGDFSTGLYEILEFNSQQETTIILYFKEGYYLLDINQNDITPLKAIEDSSMVEKLNRLRNK